MSQTPSERDQSIVRRILRAGVRYVFHMDVGNLSSERALAFLKKVKRDLKKKKMVRRPPYMPNTPLKEFVERVMAEEDWSDEDIDRWNRRLKPGRLHMTFNPLSNDEDFWLPQTA